MRTSKAALLASLLLTSSCMLDDGRAIPHVGSPAIEYAAATLAGDTVTLASLQGDVVLLNLWATWCVPCRSETPYLEEIYEQNRDRGLQVVGVSMDTGDAADDVRTFMEEFGVTYTILHDPQMRGLDLYQAPGLPATFMIDREGILRWVRYGPILEGDADFLGALEELLS
jgi:cytochrome c biogenesis protein CcmG/thiol:disulfide interchange protein DsbE